MAELSVSSIFLLSNLQDVSSSKQVSEQGIKFNSLNITKTTTLKAMWFELFIEDIIAMHVSKNSRGETK